MKNNILKWLFFGLFIRMILMPITGHEDIRLINWASLNVFDKGVNSIYLTEKSVYPPPIYIAFATWQKILSPIFAPNFKEWLSMPQVSSNTDPYAFRSFFLLKAPFIFFDIGLAFLLLQFFKDQKTRERVFRLWMLNPVALYISFMFGQFDIVPTFFVILSILLLFKKRFFLSVLFLGISATFKFFPIYFLPFFIVLAEGNYLKKFLLFTAGLLPVALSVLPFINLPAFQKNVLFGAHTANIGHASLYIGADQTISVFLIIYLVIFLSFSFREKQLDSLWKYLLAVLLAFYSLTAFHPQWFLWIVPFMIVWWIKNPEDHVLQVSLYLLYALIILLFESTVNIGLFGPLSTIFAQIPSLENTIARFLEPNLIRGYVHSVFAGLSLFIVTKKLSYGK